MKEFLIPLLSTIIGGVIAHLSAKSTLKKQFEQQQEILRLQKDEEQKLLLNIIKNILKQELINNREALNYIFTDNTLSSLKNMITSGNITSHKLSINPNHSLEFKTYEEFVFYT